ncbi:MAG: hypothetical protein NW224_05775 [Leptolyngbyaceae cyanobacterium bins.302]|nr:hypothetical protein [Leptolyngbyaceae cyanobacterium bins.302]
MGRRSKYGEPTELLRVPLSKLEAVRQVINGDFVQNDGESAEENNESSFFVQNQEGRTIEIPAYAIEPVLQLADALKFLHEHENQKCCWSIRYDIEHLWNLLPIYHAESAKLKLMGEILPTGEICQVVGYRVALSKFGDLSTGVDLKFQNGATYHYGSHRVRLFIEGEGQLGDRSEVTTHPSNDDAH